ncbi:hypothetical protein GCM10007925_02770 [Sphingomonas astaxanthinifaciens DSM 22298]|uniref:Uncharacterized protein n=1 Tax=Sphingomonas astaxanthinifaciens DSM 22298 TaxID=1123267 RepID=A0ABQ5Z3G6_9SPHN|nr:hypothetical protein GCM10007925_02770 [Sphingomonas astaxanthinifaciens DSM 22298]
MQFAPAAPITREGEGSARLDPAGKRLEFASSDRLAHSAGPLERRPVGTGMEEALGRRGRRDCQQGGEDQRARKAFQLFTALTGSLGWRSKVVMIAPAAMAMP